MESMQRTEDEGLVFPRPKSSFYVNGRLVVAGVHDCTPAEHRVVLEGIKTLFRLERDPVYENMYVEIKRPDYMDRGRPESGMLVTYMCVPLRADGRIPKNEDAAGYYWYEQRKYDPVDNSWSDVTFVPLIPEGVEVVNRQDLIETGTVDPGRWGDCE